MTKDSYVRSKAVLALGEIKDIRAVRPLIYAIEDKYLGASAAFALGMIGPEAKEAIPALIKAFPEETLVREASKENYGGKELGMEFRKNKKLIPGRKIVSTYSPLVAGVRQRPETYVTQEPDKIEETFLFGAHALTKITGENYGGDRAKWRDWWERNKEKYLK